MAKSQRGGPRVTQPRSKRPRARGEVILVIGVLIAISVCFFQASELWFTQDDAYISYRYAENALNGDGLVFNVGERVEGYTNFLWIVLLIVGGKLGIGFEIISKVLGVLSAVGIIMLTAVWTQTLWKDLHWGDGALPGAAAALLIGCNGSIAYWSISGLETVWFAFAAVLSVWFWTRRSWLVIPALVVASLTRPEGFMLCGLLALAEWIWGDGFQRALRLGIGVAILLVPYAVFKYIYYGSLLPNPFYAKTGVGWEYIQSGLEYAWLYLRHYGAYGLVAILALVAIRPLEGRQRVVPIIWLIYTLYVISVGGDVLKNQRFLVPMSALFAVSAVIGSGYLLHRMIPARQVRPATALLVVGLSILTFVYPRESLAYFRNMEVGLITKMTHVAGHLKRTDTRPFSIAASTIGKLSYDLMGHRVIDMLGLTDSAIARHPEEIADNETTWRERKFNATYLLGEDPDYILFSTGHKPSAPAERALILHSKFRRNYYTSLYYAPELRRMLAVHKRKGDFNELDKVWPDIQLAHDVNQAWNYVMRGVADSAVALMHKVKTEGPGDFCIPDQFLAEQMLRVGVYERAMAYADSAIAMDSSSLVAWRVKGTVYTNWGDTASLPPVLERLNELAPWLSE